MMSPLPVRIGVLGCSDIARRKFMPALVKCDKAVLAAVSSRCMSKADVFAGKTDCRRLNHEELIASPSVDLVYISLPNHLHEEWSIRALDAGKHVICEKPLALSLKSAQRMIKAAERNERLLYENLMFLHHPQHNAVKSLLDSGRLGRVVSLRSVFGFPMPAAGNFRRYPEQGGGAFHDLARYPLGAAINLLTGLPSEFRGVSRWQDGLNLAMAGTALTATKELFTFTIAFGQQYESYYEITGEKGSLRVDRAYTAPAEFAHRIMLLEGNSFSEIPVAAADQFQLMIDAVATIVRSGDVIAKNRRTLLMAELADKMERGCSDE
jgi:predicted dehydrogenase